MPENNILKVIVMAIIGGCIGYITNKLAIKLIFRPINPIKIPILNIEIWEKCDKKWNDELLGFYFT